MLRQVRQHIAQYPERFCAAQWAWARNIRAVLMAGAPPEGFRCCIAGHVLLLSNYCDEPTLLRLSVQRDDGFIGRAAARLLGLSREQARRLFYPTGWPEPYRSWYYQAADQATEAMLAVSLLDAWLQPVAGDGWPASSPVESKAPVLT
ncbi:MAG: hypothetical protein Q9M35_11790 [Rhodothermus sp.]|nr:hypothetical protein [Rhodothermus sp.]